jgi:hypothetical protein
MNISRSHEVGRVSGTHKVATDTLGLLLVVVVLAASTQDRDGAKPVLHDTYLRTRVRFVFADGAFAGRLLDWAKLTRLPPCCAPHCTSCASRPASVGSPRSPAGGRSSAPSPG